MLPANWQERPLSEVVTFNPRHESGLPDDLDVSFVPMPKVSDRGRDLLPHESRKLADVRRGYTHFRDGDVLFAKITPCMENGKAAVARNLISGIGCGTTELHVLRPRDSVLAEWLYFYISQERFRKEAQRNMTGSAGQLRVPLSFLKEQTIPVPDSPDEQRRIAAKLDHIAARLTDTKARLDTVPAILKRFRMSVLAAACSGRLRADWRDDESTSEGDDSSVFAPVPSSWSWSSVGLSCDRIVDCPHSTPKWVNTGRLCVRTTNFRPGFLDLAERRYVSDESFAERISRLKPESGDILYSREGGILGVACMIPPGVELCLGQRMMLFRVGRILRADFLVL